MDIRYSHPSLRFQVRLEEAEFFTAKAGYGDTTDVQVRLVDVHVYLDSTSEPSVSGDGLQVKANGHVGARQRNVYVIPWEDLPSAVQDVITAHIASVKGTIGGGGK